MSMYCCIWHILHCVNLSLERELSSFIYFHTAVYALMKTRILTHLELGVAVPPAASDLCSHILALTIMERLFSPCTRLHDLLVENQDDIMENGERFHIETLRELKLDVSTEEILSAERASHTQTCTRCWEMKIQLRG
jgi:hypothetical protein